MEEEEGEEKNFFKSWLDNNLLLKIKFPSIKTTSFKSKKKFWNKKRKDRVI